MFKLRRLLLLAVGGAAVTSMLSTTTDDNPNDGDAARWVNETVHALRVQAQTGEVQELPPIPASWDHEVRRRFQSLLDEIDQHTTNGSAYPSAPLSEERFQELEIRAFAILDAIRDQAPALQR